MKLRAILPVTALLLFACGPGTQVKTGKTTVTVENLDSPAAAPTVAPPKVLPPHPSILTAIKSIFSNQPKMVAFGEIHKNDKLSYKSTAAHFAEDILPHLPDHGIKDLVVGFLPDDAVIDAELEIFMKRGTLGLDTPNMFDWMDGPDLCGKLAILKVARAKGIRVYGGHLSLTEAPDPYKVSSMYDSDPEKFADLVRQHTAQKAQAVLDQGKAVATFGGMRHNNHDPLKEDAQASYGDEFAAQLGNKYVEVDLLVPELSEGVPEQIAVAGWEKQIPAEGITSIQQGQRFLIIFPKTSNVKTLQSLQLLHCL